MKPKFKNFIVKITCFDCDKSFITVEKVKKGSPSSCPSCSGTKFLFESKVGIGEDCKKCDGKGTYIELFSFDNIEKKCFDCDGFGKK